MTNTSKPNGIQKKIVLITVIGSLGWIALVFLAPLLRDYALSASGLCYTAFSPVCHQIPSRCFWIAGHPLAVCTRCLGVYIGFTIGACLYPFFRGLSSVDLPKKEIFILMSMPIVIDTAGNILMIWMTGEWMRFGIGVLWGSILPYYFIPGLTDALNHKIISSRFGGSPL